MISIDFSREDLAALVANGLEVAFSCRFGGVLTLDVRWFGLFGAEYSTMLAFFFSSVFIVPGMLVDGCNHEYACLVLTSDCTQC